MAASIDKRTSVMGSLKTSGVRYPSTPYSSTSAYEAGYTYLKKSGGVTPGFHSPSRTGRLKPTGFNFLLQKSTSDRGHDIATELTLKPKDYGYNSYSQTGNMGTANIAYDRQSDAVISELSAIASNKLLNAIKGQSINLAQAYAEREQTVQLVAGTATKVAKSIRSLRRGDFIGAARDLGVLAKKRANSRFNKSFARRQSEAVSQGWLELQYGWKPLLNDVYGACEQLAKRHSRIIYATQTVQSSRAKDLYKLTSSTFDKSKSTTLVNGEDKIVVKMGCTYSTSNPVQSTAAQLGITNPLVVAWELLPFSFVADWFLPVGQALGTLDATNGLEFYSGYKTVFRRTNVSKISTVTGVSYGRRNDVLWVSSFEEVSVTRTPLGSFPSPSLPRFKNPASIVHMANAIALVSQLFRK
jgi:hypothetical protein